ncbi:MAG: DUF3014 domain-containing protein [Anaeromyxobacteraceae bacterium]
MDDRTEEPIPQTSLRRPSPLPWILLALAVIAGGVYAWFRLRTPPAEPAPVAQQAAPAPVEPEPTPEQAAAGEAKLPDLLPKVSANPLVQKGLSGNDVVRRVVVVVDNLAEGVTPRRELAFLAPEGKFEATRTGAGLVISPASCARYDAFGDAVASVDEQAVAAAWRVARPALQTAYRMLGYPGIAFDRALGKALRRIANAPVKDGEVALVDQSGVYTYADPKLEALPAVEKHLLRMGPRNGRLVQAKARALLTALGLPEK